ncbi:type II toxin-antitoxin system PemK/MazF family toxin [Paenibacillus chitinolyticus]|uniref:mRNA interferase n=1 Tax=Paenibacillus chitinolyticus TaxID=79263 RepID=A0A410X522_9BACL|nr:type II toxin-antitoxin system PemK/MazF family toxin [Paenibacillus chitinolyticus]MCY9594159.1 type II toxin-antitoxin system PemK/MazF family toxin [Paenibacillus chitinolyticus]MCY9599646.1 type II toxin-antitoxin system PemK/MazF family toxin [Paenibacillus chitinolyticus]QAV21707.1 type II toxin-antitoxin system PemK/MazF family toxin [Paenibacillus chitinolyticus]
MTQKVEVNRGEVWTVRLDGNVGSEQGGIRPCVIISNQKGNKFGTTVIVAAISSQIQKAKLPTHVVLEGGVDGVLLDSVVMLEQVRTVDKSRLINKVAELSSDVMQKVTQAHKISCADMFN